MSLEILVLHLIRSLNIETTWEDESLFYKYPLLALVFIIFAIIYSGEN